MNLTNNEVAVFKAIAENNLMGGISDITDITSPQLTAQQARGVIANLVMKNLILVETHGSQQHYWPIHPEHGACFLCDYLNGDEGRDWVNMVTGA